MRRFHRPAGGGAAGAAEAAAGARARRHGARRRPAGGAAGGGSPLAPFWGLAVVENRHGREARVVWAAEGLLGRAAGLDQAQWRRCWTQRVCLGSDYRVLFLIHATARGRPVGDERPITSPPRCRALLLVCKLLQEAKAIGDEFLQLEKYVNLNYMGERGASVMWVSAAGCPGPGPRRVWCSSTCLPPHPTQKGPLLRGGAVPPPAGSARPQQGGRGAAAPILRALRMLSHGAASTAQPSRQPRRVGGRPGTAARALLRASPRAPPCRVRAPQASTRS